MKPICFSIVMALLFNSAPNWAANHADKIVGVVVTMKVKDGQSQAFEKAMSDAAAAVKANEKGNLQYVLMKSEEPNTYVMIERYKDKAALMAHGASDHFKKTGTTIGPLLAAPPGIMKLQQVTE